MRVQTVLLLTLVAASPGWAQVRKPIPMPQVQTIGQGEVWRKSNNSLPPWREIEITNVFAFKKKPIIGDKVTIVPLDVDIAPLELRIVKAEKKEDGCDESLPGWWEVELQKISEKTFFEIASRSNRREEFPFDVCVIYPAVRFARQIKRENLTKGMLPKGVARNTAIAAIDLTNDGIPDVLIVEYCCGHPRKSAGEECDYTCGKTFKRIRNIWRLIDTSAPC
jgi:hypothetical protein